MAEYDNGLSWAYFPPNTSFKLCNVPWDMSYRDIVRFTDHTAQDDYFNALPGVTVTNTSGHRFNQPVKLNIPFNKANQYNYIIVKNDYPQVEQPRYWYYFIQNITMVNLYVSQFNIMLDVIQSFQFDVQLGNCYVERGHIGIANENAEQDGGRAYLDIPEGLDTGSESQITSQSYNYFIKNGDKFADSTASIVVLSTVDLSSDPGSVDNPKMSTSSGVSINNIPNGVNMYVFKTVVDFFAFMTMGAEYPWIMQNIQKIYMVPNDTPFEGVGDLGLTQITPFGKTGTNIGMFTIQIGQMDIDRDIATDVNFRDNFIIPDRYRNLKKFKTFPYAWIEVTLMNGNSVIIRPQDIYQNNLTLHEVAYYGPPTPRAAFYVRSLHGGDNGGDVMREECGEMLNSTIGVVDYPSLAVVNNAGQIYLASNAHSIDYQRQTADWSQQKTSMGINNAYAQAQLSAGYADQQTALSNRNRSALAGISNQSATRSTDIAQNQANFDYGMQQLNTIGGGVANVLGNAATGNIGGAIGSAVGAGIGAYANNASYNQGNQTRAAQLGNTIDTTNAQTSQSNSYASQQTGLSNRQALQFADMNRSMATAVASGDYANAIAGINAKIQDTALMSPSVAGQMGGDVLLYASNRWRIWRRYRQIMPAAMRDIGEYWLRYGYYVQRFLKPPESWQTMEHFTFWKMHELYIRSSTCPEEFKLAIKGIFEKGVTVWNNPDDIGVIDYADNNPLTGVRY